MKVVGWIEIYRDGAATGGEVTAELDWMTSEKISTGKEVLLNYFYDEFGCFFGFCCLIILKARKRKRTRRLEATRGYTYRAT